MKQPIDSKSRMCYKEEQQVKYIVVGCTILALSEHTNDTKRRLVTSTG
jgi:hypothetical protein